MKTNLGIEFHFKGESRLFSDGGINDYTMRRDRNNKLVFSLRGTFTGSELRAMADAASFENDRFELPGSFTK